jgi:hypothetical protein
LRNRFNTNVAAYKINPTKDARTALLLKYHPNKNPGSNQARYTELFKNLGIMLAKYKDLESAPAAAQPLNNSGNRSAPRNNSKRPLAIMPPNYSNRQLALRPNRQLAVIPSTKNKGPLAIMPPNYSNRQLVPRPLTRGIQSLVPVRNSNVVKGFNALPGYNTIRNKEVQNKRNLRIGRIAKRRKIINRARLALGNPVVRNGDVYFNSRP